MKLDNLIGKRFERLIVIARAANNPRGYARWLCQCDCGETNEVLASELKRGHARSCGCLRREVSRAKQLLPEGEGAFNALYSQYVKSAKQRDIVFALTRQEFKALADKNCHYCGSGPSLKIYGENRMESRNVNGNFTYTGIDRKDSDRGYTAKNCVTCCKICNFAKNDLPYSTFIDYINRLVAFRK